MNTDVVYVVCDGDAEDPGAQSATIDEPSKAVNPRSHLLSEKGQDRLDIISLLSIMATLSKETDEILGRATVMPSHRGYKCMNSKLAHPVWFSVRAYPAWMEPWIWDSKGEGGKTPRQGPLNRVVGSSGIRFVRR